MAVLVALAVLLPTAAVATLPVEPYAPYEPQTKCKPKPKQGTLELARWIAKTYPGSGTPSISRDCSHGGTSEHKEGRALDWMVNHGSARDRGYVQDFLGRLFATDAEGNEHALARRMGVMYIIWNDRIWSSYRQFEPRAYLSSACRTKKKCSPTLRHRDHVHLSLSRAGGRGDTSWYHRDDPVPPPPPPPPPPPDPEPEPEPPADRVLDLSRKPYAAVRVPLDGSTRTTPFHLKAGRTYQVTAAGLYTYGGPHQVADASCAWSRDAGTWTTRPADAGSVGSLNLLVGGKAVFDQECRAGRHSYATTVTPQRTGPLRLEVAGRRLDAQGRLVVAVSRPGGNVREALPRTAGLRSAPDAPEPSRGHGLLTETLSVPADRAGVRTTHELRRGVAYRVSVTGTVSLGGGVAADARCLRVDGRWYRQASLDRWDPGADHGNLFLDRTPFEGRPTASGCTGHGYVAELTARRTSRLKLAVWDPKDRGDNSGALTVRVQRLTPLEETPGRASAERPGRTFPWTRDRDWFEVAGADAAGAVSSMRLRRGETVRVVVRGRHSSHGVPADAACVRVDGTWRPADPRVALRQDPLELWVDGRPVDWRPLGETPGCSDEHGYLATVVARRPGPLRLAVLDVDHRDNGGALEVTLLRGA